jgi:uncharacterized cofD-like protein
MQRKKVVTIGGGTGSYMLLSGLRDYPIDISAVISMVDDGGSGGVLRDELGVLPPGDVRQALVALSRSPHQLRELMTYRFSEGGLDGHSFGNLFLSALEKITGDFGSAVEEASRILQIQGEVLPVTLADSNLYTELSDGTVLEGQDVINKSVDMQERGIKRLYIEPPAAINPKVAARIAEADMIVIGPGGLYHSLIPDLLVGGVVEAIRNSQAVVVYNANLINKPGHTLGFTVDDYVRQLEVYLGAGVVDYVTMNTTIPDPSTIDVERYTKAHEEQVPTVITPLSAPTTRPYTVVQADLLSNTPVVAVPGDKISHLRSYIRHDSAKLARVLMDLLEKSKNRSATPGGI